MKLVVALRDAEPHAAEAFHDRIRPTLERTLRRLLGVSDADFDDVRQEALIELVRSIDRFRGDGSLDGWVSTVTARAVYRLIRARQAERRVFDASVEDVSFARSFDDAEAEAGARELLVRVRRHLDAIEPAKAWTYLLHDVLGYALAEIAEITGVSVAAAQTRLVRGRRELDSRLAHDVELADRLQREEAR